MTRGPAFLFDSNAPKVRGDLAAKVERLGLTWRAVRAEAFENAKRRDPVGMAERIFDPAGVCEIPIGSGTWGAVLRMDVAADTTDAELAAEMLRQLDAWFAAQDELPNE